MQRIILHIDFDSFFASVEQQAHPEFRRRPLGVTATNGRNCIIASSREAKKLGIGTGSRVHDARQICPDIALAPANFTHYWEVSKQFIKLCRDFSPYVEVFSIDELFMDATLTAHLFGGIDAMIRQMKQRIHDEIGEYITVSVGISHNKLLAKLGSGLKKPNGACYITPRNLEAIYRVAKLTDICGIGDRIAARLHMMGIYNLMTLRITPLSSLIAEFGNVEGNFLYSVGRGEDDRDVTLYTDEQPVKSVSRNYCLPRNEYDKRVVLQNIFELAEEVGLKLRRLHMRAKTAGVYLRGENNLGGNLSHDYYFNSGEEIFKTCLEVITSHCHPEQRQGSKEILHSVQNDTYNSLASLRSLQNDSNFKGYIRQLSIWAGNLKSEYELPLPLLEEEKRKERLVKITDEINERFGDHTIRNGFLLYAAKLTTVPNGYMADRYERAKLTRFAL